MLPAINTLDGADKAIIHELSVIRAKGDLPAFRRGRMFYDFDVGKVRVAPTPDAREL